MENKYIKLEALSLSMDELAPLFIERLELGQFVKFSPKGISMLPMIRQGIDTVTLAPIVKPLKKYDIPLYRRDDGKYVMHRIVGVGDCYVCMGDNQFKKESGLRHDQMIAVVSAFARGDKEYSVNALSYKLYCRAWHYSRFPRRVLRAVKGRIIRFLRKRRMNQ